MNNPTEPIDIDDVLETELETDETLSDRARDAERSVYVGGAGR